MTDPLLDFPTFARANLKITTKSGQLQPLRFNIFQERVNHTIQELKKARKPVRIIILKARQLGLSTQCTAYLYHQTVTNLFTKSLLIADDSDNTNNLFNMVKKYYDFFDPKMRPMRRLSNAKELVFENPDVKTKAENPGLMSGIVVQTAGKETAGRSGTVQNLHCSEFAFWPNAGTTVTGLFQSVPFLPNTSIFIESTANGISGRGEEFYKRWRMAEDGGGDFIPLFFPWFENPEYEREVPPDFTLDDEEEQLLALYPEMNLRKLAFRRYKVKNEMGSALMDPLDQWNQEFPTTSNCAFISSGRPVFNIQKILAHIKDLDSRPYKTGDINAFGNFREDPKGPYKLFSQVDPDRIYTVGADIAEGLEEGDYSTMCGLSRSFEQVLSYHGHIAPDLFGRELCKAGKLLNNALICPESNNHGLTTITKIKELQYPMVYTREVEDRVEVAGSTTLGWNTNRKTKMLMLDDFVSLYRDGLIKIYDIELLKEMTTLVVESDGDIPLNGKDRVVAICLAIQAMKQAPMENSYKAFNPNLQNKTPKSLEEKLAMLNRKNRDTQF